MQVINVSSFASSWRWPPLILALQFKCTRSRLIGYCTTPLVVAILWTWFTSNPPPNSFFNCSICINTCKTDSVVQKQINLDQDLSRRSSSLPFAINISYICISSRCPSPLSSHSLISQLTNAQCVLCKVRCHCIFYGPGIRYSDIFCVPGIRYSVIIKLPCALLQTGHLETVHASVADTGTYFAGLDAPVVDTGAYFGEIANLEFENH